MVRFGELSGKDIVYDHDGKLILRSGETVMLVSSERNVYVRDLESGSRGSRILEPTKEDGSLYITNLRVAFIRTPDPWRAAWGDLTPFGVADAVAKAARARDLRSLGAFEYFEVPLSEITSFTVKRRKYATIIASDGHNKLRIEIDRKNSQDQKLVLLEQLISAQSVQPGVGA